MDFGAEYVNYASDLTRCVPVNGRFTKRQKDVYISVLKVMTESKKLLVTGLLLSDYEGSVGKIMERELVNLGLLSMKDLKSFNKSPSYKKYYMHGTSHHLGLDVHDVSDPKKPLCPGMVLTCEPGIYIPEEGLGIRLENDILITKNEPEDLMGSILISPEEIEVLREFMFRGGFVMVDDFWGQPHLDDMYMEMGKIFPDREIVKLDTNHEIFHIFFDIDQVAQVPGRMVTWDFGGFMRLDDPAYPPEIYAVLDDDGRVMMVANYNTDLGDGWEHTFYGPYPTKYTNEAYKIGINFLIYAFSH